MVELLVILFVFFAYSLSVFIMAMTAITLIWKFHYGHPLNWRLYSPLHYFSSGPNSYFRWLDKHQPDWWTK